jgi:hypothetical protein
MTTDPLWTEPARPHGLIRRALDAKIALLRDAGNDVPEDLAIVTAALADRIDSANAGGDRRGYVMLSAEYRQARHDLFDGITDNGGGPDPLTVALADFRNAQAGNNPGPVPAE